MSSRMRQLLAILTLPILVPPFTASAEPHAETHYEIALQAQTLFFDISEKRGPRYSDDFSNLGFSLGAYREASRNAYWGAVIEYASATGRNAAFGEGTILSFRPVNYLRKINDKYQAEFFLGAAQYEWEKTARGYYLGTNLRYRLSERPLSLALSYRFYQDLAYDSPLGDVIVQGSSLGASCIYHF